MVFAKREWISIALMYLSAAFFYFLMRDYEYNAAFFPGLLVVLMCCMATIKVVVEIYRGVKQSMAHIPCVDGPKYPLLRVGFMLLMFILYILTIEDIGFYTTAFLFFFLSTVGIQTTKRTPKGMAIRFLICLGFTVFLYILFTVILQTLLPRGILV